MASAPSVAASLAPNDTTALRIKATMPFLYRPLCGAGATTLFGRFGCKWEVTYRIAFGDPTDLSLADGMHRLVTFDCSPRPFSRTEARARRNPLLDGATILLDDVVQIRRSLKTATPAEFTGLLQLRDRAGRRRMAVHVDHPRRGSAAEMPPAEQWWPSSGHDYPTRSDQLRCNRTA